MNEEKLFEKWAESGEKEKFNPKRKTYRSPKELKADVEEIICNNGSTWIEKSSFLEECEDANITASDIEGLTNEGFFSEETANSKTYISTKEIKENEEKIAELIWFHAKKKVINLFEVPEVESLAKKAEEMFNMVFALEQKMAVIKAINSPIMVITGVAGAGKTTIVKAILKIYNWLGVAKRACCLAPTGKASKRLEESLNTKSKGEGKEEVFKVQTVDKRVLEYGYITEHVTIIDEASFLDTKNLKKLLEKAKRSEHIIFLGDQFQLSSVGCGMVLRDLIDSGVVTVQKLNKSFRVDKDAINIQRNTKAIREFSAVETRKEALYDETGNRLVANGDITVKFTEGDDFRIYADVPEEKIFQMLASTYEEKVKQYNGRENVCVLIPFRDIRKGKITSEGFNKYIEKKLYGSEGFHRGSQVMQLTNTSYAQNGSIGTVTKIDNDAITVKYKDNAEHTYTKIEAKKELTLAYAMSVHKSQGSEYDCVIMATLNEHKKMLNRNLIYTGITRAKKEVDYFYDSECLQNALNKEASQIRITMLKERLQAIKEKHDKEKNNQG